MHKVRLHGMTYSSLQGKKAQRKRLGEKIISQKNVKNKQQFSMRKLNFISTQPLLEILVCTRWSSRHINNLP